MGTLEGFPHINLMNLKGKNAIITGGTRGIGRGICELLLSLECNVTATGTKINKNKCTEGIEKLNYLQLDYLSSESLELFLDYIKGFEKIDILINNAGINIVEPIDDLNKENWDKVLQVNLTGPMFLSRAVASIMKRHENGKILNISSIWGVIGKEKRNAYAASKTGLIGITRTIALDLAPYNILVNALCPGFTVTDLTRSTLNEKEIRNLSNQIPLGRLAETGDIAKTAVFLCSDLNSYITGQTIIADGGFTIR